MTALLALERSCAPRTAEAAVPAPSIFPHDLCSHTIRPGINARKGRGPKTLAFPPLAYRPLSCFSSSGGFLLLFLGGFGSFAGFALGAFSGCDSFCGRAFSARGALLGFDSLSFDSLALDSLALDAAGDDSAGDAARASLGDMAGA